MTTGRINQVAAIGWDKRKFPTFLVHNPSGTRCWSTTRKQPRNHDTTRRGKEEETRLRLSRTRRSERPHHRVRLPGTHNSARKQPTHTGGALVHETSKRSQPHDEVTCISIPFPVDSQTNHTDSDRDNGRFSPIRVSQPPRLVD